MISSVVVSMLPSLGDLSKKQDTLHSKCQAKVRNAQVDNHRERSQFPEGEEPKVVALTWLHLGNVWPSHAASFGSAVGSGMIQGTCERTSGVADHNPLAAVAHGHTLAEAAVCFPHGASLGEVWN